MSSCLSVWPAYHFPPSISLASQLASLLQYCKCSQILLGTSQSLSWLILLSKQTNGMYIYIYTYLISIYIQRDILKYSTQLQRVRGEKRRNQISGGGEEEEEQYKNFVAFGRRHAAAAVTTTIGEESKYKCFFNLSQLSKSQESSDSSRNYFSLFSLFFSSLYILFSTKIIISGASMATDETHRQQSQQLQSE